MPKRLASAGQASSSILDCDRIIVPVCVLCAAGGTEQDRAGSGAGRRLEHDCMWLQDTCCLLQQHAGTSGPAHPPCTQVRCPRAPPCQAPPQVHQGNHWVCAVIDLQNRKFVYYDSLKVGGLLCCWASPSLRPS